MADCPFPGHDGPSTKQEALSETLTAIKHLQPPKRAGGRKNPYHPIRTSRGWAKGFEYDNKITDTIRNWVNLSDAALQYNAEEEKAIDAEKARLLREGQRHAVSVTLKEDYEYAITYRDAITIIAADSLGMPRTRVKYRSRVKAWKVVDEHKDPEFTKKIAEECGAEWWDTSGENPGVLVVVPLGSVERFISKHQLGLTESSNKPATSSTGKKPHTRFGRGCDRTTRSQQDCEDERISVALE